MCLFIYLFSSRHLEEAQLIAVMRQPSQVHLLRHKGHKINNLMCVHLCGNNFAMRDNITSKDSRCIAAGVSREELDENRKRNLSERFLEVGDDE